MLWVAEGGGTGRLKPAPGTWGSLLGLVIAWILARFGYEWMWALGCGLAPAVATPVCSRAARLLGEKDPSSVVFDEIVAMPLVFTTFVALCPQAVHALSHETWWLAGFAAFRLFDIWKPTPIRQLQRLHGGLGIVADDLAAALLAGAVLALACPLVSTRG